MSRFEGPGGREKRVDLGACKQEVVKVLRCVVKVDGIERSEMFIRGRRLSFFLLILDKNLLKA